MQMSTNRLTQALYRSRLLQVGLLMLMWQVGECISHFTHIPIPGNIIGLLMLLGLLCLGLINLNAVTLGAEWFLAELLLFFIPAAPSIIKHHEFWGLTGIKVLAIILLGTAIIMICTAYIVDWCYIHIESKSNANESNQNDHT